MLVSVLHTPQQTKGDSSNYQVQKHIHKKRIYFSFMSVHNHESQHAIKKEERDSRQVRKVQIRVPHPCYDATDKVNDLMLFKVS